MSSEDGDTDKTNAMGNFLGSCKQLIVAADGLIDQIFGAVCGENKDSKSHFGRCICSFFGFLAIFIVVFGIPIIKDPSFVTEYLHSLPNQPPVVLGTFVAGILAIMVLLYAVTHNAAISLCHATSRGFKIAFYPVMGYNYALPLIL